MNTLITPGAMHDAIEYAVNGTDYQNGASDAIVHVAWLTTDTKTDKEIARAQEVLDADIMEPDYARGYWDTWNTLFGMLGNTGL